MPAAVQGLRRALRRRRHAAAQVLGVAPPVRAYLGAHRGDARLQLGCGGAVLAGWLNTDRDPPAGALYLDVTRPFRLPPASFDRVLCEHVIEHLALAAGRRMLAECARVLRPGGRIRVSTPDLARVAGLCAGVAGPGSEDYVTAAVAAFVPGEVGSAAALTLNNLMRAWDHRFLYDEPTLARALLDAGFTAVARHDYRVSDDPAFRGVEGAAIDGLGLDLRAWETLALEATR